MDSKCSHSVTKQPHQKGFRVGRTMFPPVITTIWNANAALQQFYSTAIETAITKGITFWILAPNNHKYPHYWSKRFIMYKQQAQAILQTMM